MARRKTLQQTHLCLGLKGLSLDHKDRYGLYALNAAIGGSVSSRLFQEIREKRGLAYSIYSYISAYSDTGTLTIYAGDQPKEAIRVVELIRREMQRIHRQGMDREELQRIESNERRSDAELGKYAKSHEQVGERRALSRTVFDVRGSHG